MYISLNPKPFDIELLLLPSISIILFGFTVLFLMSKDIILSFCIPTLKSLVFLIYFNFFFDGTFTLVDDWSYFKQSLQYKEMADSFLHVITNVNKLVALVGSTHYLYHIWNIISFELYGEYYFAPVALNIMLTFLTASVLHMLLIEVGILKKYAIIFSIFYLIHWSTLSWSSILNLKDFLVQFLLMLYVYIFVKYEKYGKLRYIVLGVILFFILEFIRFYIPFLIIISYIIFRLIELHAKTIRDLLSKLIVSMVSLVAIIIILYTSFMYIPMFRHAYMLLSQDFINPVFGTLRFVLTPIPFNTKEAYDFLVFASLLDWLSVPYLITGVFLLYKLNNRHVKFILITTAVIITFYGVYGELQGPRHRIQIYTFISVFQFAGLLATIYGIDKTRRAIYTHKESVKVEKLLTQ